MDGTVALLKTSPMRVGGEVDESAETLLLAIAQDENSNILPVAFALVEWENAESWTFFLSHLRQHVTPQEGVLVISDRYNDIKAALEAPESANFALSFKGQDARRMLVNAAYAKTEAEFDYWFDIMRTENSAMCNWANRLEYDKWTQHQDGGRRFGHMTTNISECVNSVLMGTRNLPVLVKAIERNLKDVRCFTVTLFDRHQAEYTVAETTPTDNFSLGTYQVFLRDRTCDCGYFQTLHYPCCHAIACCAQSRLDWAMYVHEVYTMSKVFSVYRMGFLPPIPEGLWPLNAGLTIVPNPNMRRAREGQLRSTRIRNTMDEADTSQSKRCGLCRQTGHTRRTCPQRGSAPSVEAYVSLGRHD
ncbi:uncharacterized protein LOC107466857 [Arachis duranensis]|uniref:Uncharacterized protein LOC107466857 n=1 Tax=Arachis duranensis TaxID=130453 RepID=A0A6P4C2U5_ARADU|nr:uncharacterized protein LOC107466857 [Arachis duranensis]